MRILTWTDIHNPYPTVPAATFSTGHPGQQGVDGHLIRETCPIEPVCPATGLADTQDPELIRGEFR